MANACKNEQGWRQRENENKLGGRRCLRCEDSQWYGRPDVGGIESPLLM